MLRKTTKRHTSNFSRQTSNGKAFSFESLENRMLMAGDISISDATAFEGNTSIGFIDAFVSAGSGGLATPKYVVFGPDNNLYVGSRETDEVLRFDGTTGAFMGAFVTSGSGGIDAPWPMLFGPDANNDGTADLYVAGLLSHNVLRYDGKTGVLIDEFVKSTNNGGLYKPIGMSFGPDAHLYVSMRDELQGSSAGDEVLRFNGVTGAPMGAFVKHTDSGGLYNPNGVVFGADITGDGVGELFVANTGHSVNRYNGATGSFMDVFIPAASGGLNITSVLTFRDDGYLYVTSQGSHQVLRYDATSGAFVDAIVPAQSGGLNQPGGLAFDATGNLYVASNLPSQVLRYGPASQAAFTVSLSSASEFPVTVNYTTADGTAAAGSDYAAASGTLTFAPGQMTRTILVKTLNDGAAEPSETFSIVLSVSDGATIADGQGVATIEDDEAPPTKFYMVNDASQDRTYEYNSIGTAVENYALNSGNTAPRGAASTAAGDKVWVVDANKNVYVYNAGGALLGSWTAGGLHAAAQVEGVATNGTDIWLVDAKQDRVYRYAGAAGRLSGSQNADGSFALNSGNKDPKDIVTDGTSVWVVNNSTTDKVFKYTVGGGFLGSWIINSGGGSPTGITIDPTDVGDIWIADNASDRVYQFADAAGLTSGSRLPSDSFALAAGNTNPQGIADPPAANSQTRISVAALASNASLNARTERSLSRATKGASGSVGPADLRMALDFVFGGDQEFAPRRLRKAIRT